MEEIKEREEKSHEIDLIVVSFVLEAGHVKDMWFELQLVFNVFRKTLRRVRQWQSILSYCKMQSAKWKN